METKIKSAVHTPLAVLTELFHSNVQSSEGRSSSIGSSRLKAENLPERVEATEIAFANLLNGAGVTPYIPMLNASNRDTLPPWSLVRFRGMIQNTKPEHEFCNVLLGPPTADGAHQRISLYQEDFAVFQEPEDRDRLDEPNTDMGSCIERETLYLVSPPGESKWSADLAVRKPSMPFSMPSTNSSSSSSAATDASEKPSRKRPAPETSSDEAIGDDDEMEVEEGFMSETKRQCQANVAVLVSGDEVERENGCVECMARLYRTPSREALPRQINQLIECIAILLPHPLPEHYGQQQQQQGTDEMMLDAWLPEHGPGASLCQIHILAYVDSPSILPRTSTESPLSGVASPLEELISFVSRCLGGDELASMYLLCNMISGVYDRKGTLPLGNFPVNFVGAHAHPAYEIVSEIYSSLLERHRSLNMSMDILQNQPLLPKKDYSGGFLLRAPLQLASETNLLIDETPMKEGQLNEVGTQNMLSLCSLIENQQIEYDYTYYRLPMNTNYPTAVFSTSSSIFKIMCIVPLRPQNAPAQNPRTLFEGVAPDRLLGWRQFLQDCKFHRPYQIPNGMQAELENDIAEEMKNHPTQFQKSVVVSRNTLHVWFLLARLLSILRGEKELTRSAWEQMKTLEKQRHERIVTSVRQP